MSVRIHPLVRDSCGDLNLRDPVVTFAHSTKACHLREPKLRLDKPLD